MGFLKIDCNVCNYMIYSELGRCPLIMQRKLKIMKYWCKRLKVENCILKSYENLRLDAENRVSSCMNWHATWENFGLSWSSCATIFDRV